MQEARDASVEIEEVSYNDELNDITNLSQPNTGKKRTQRQGRINGYQAAGILIPNRIGNQDMEM